MFMLGKEKQLSTEDSTRQTFLMRLFLNKIIRIKNIKTASTLFEIFHALLIKYLDDNDDNDNGAYHIHRLVTIIYNRATLYWS